MHKREVPELEPGCGSWIIVNKATGEAVAEIYSRGTIETLSDHFVALTAMQWLGAFNRATEMAR